ncbi:MAG: hypothetical protein AAF329_19570 [Cyanobacteria bacterium P01_A01_bin.17]
MKLMQMLNQAFRYLTEAMVRTFTPAEHHYPATGVVPFMGDDYEQSWAD